MSLVSTERLSKRYRGPWSPRARGGGRWERMALAEVSFELAEGDVAALIGPNGAGKSTLLRILAGLLRPTDGRARIDGLDIVRDRPKVRGKLGVALADDRGLSPRLTLRENLRFFGALYGLRTKDADARVAELAGRWEAAHLLDREVRTLSTGERARGVLLRTLLHRPRVLLLDELTRTLDPGAAVRLRGQLREEVRATQPAVLFATHDMAEAESVATRVLLLDGGRLLTGTFDELRGAAAHAFAQEQAP